MGDQLSSSRRRFLKGASTVSIAGLCGCIGSDDEDRPVPTAADAGRTSEEEHSNTSTKGENEASKGGGIVFKPDGSSFTIENQTGRTVEAVLKQIWFPKRGTGYPIIFPNLKPGETREVPNYSDIYAPEYSGVNAEYETPDRKTLSPRSKPYLDQIKFADEEYNISADVTAKFDDGSNGSAEVTLPNPTDINTEDVREMTVAFETKDDYQEGFYQPSWREIGPGNLGCSVENGDLIVHNSGSGYWSTRYRVNLASTTSEESFTFKYEKPDVEAELENLKMDGDSIDKVDISISKSNNSPIHSPKLMLFQNGDGPSEPGDFGGGARIHRTYLKDFSISAGNQSTISLDVYRSVDFPVDEEDEIGVILYGANHLFGVYDFSKYKWTDLV